MFCRETSPKYFIGCLYWSSYFSAYAICMFVWCVEYSNGSKNSSRCRATQPTKYHRHIPKIGRSTLFHQSGCLTICICIPHWNWIIRMFISGFISSREFVKRIRNNKTSLIVVTWIELGANANSCIHLLFAQINIERVALALRSSIEVSR